MFSHAFTGTNDFKRSFQFYDAVLPGLGWVLKFRDDVRPWAGWKPLHAERPLFLIGRPHDKMPASSGNGQMNALISSSRSAVDLFYIRALEHGGTCDGPPAERPEYHPHYYGAYVLDPDGNKICVCCHEPE